MHKELKREINEIIMHINASSLLPYFLNEPTHVKHFQKTFDESGAKTFEERAILLHRGRAGRVTCLIHEAVDFCKGNSNFNLDYLKRVLTVNIGWVFEKLPREYRYNYTHTKGLDYIKEFEFFRHIRNACAHGNKFRFDTRSLKLWKNKNYEASWCGLVVQPGLEGEECFFDFMGPGDGLHLLTFIRDNL